MPSKLQGGINKEDAPSLVASQGSRPLTISIRLSGVKEKVNTPPVNPKPAGQHKVPSVPTYRQLPSTLRRVHYSQSTKSTISKLQMKRKEILTELSDLRDESMLAFPLSPEPIRRKCQYDYFLEESLLVANDFLEERKWKINAAYVLAHEARAFYYQHIYPKQEKRSNDVLLVEQHKKIGHLLASMVDDFWGKVRKAKKEGFGASSQSLEEEKEKQTLVTCSSEVPEESQDCKYPQPKENLDTYVQTCFKRHIPAVIEINESNQSWSRILLKSCEVFQYCDSGFGVVFAPDDAVALVSTLLHARFNHFDIVTVARDTAVACRKRAIFIFSPDTVLPLDVAPVSLLAFVSVSHSLPSLLPSIPITHSVLVHDTSKVIPSSILPLLFAPAVTEREDLSGLIASGVFVVPSSSKHSTTRQVRSAKDNGEGGQFSLSIEAHTVPFSENEAVLRDGLLDAFEERLDATPSSQSVFEAMLVLHHQLDFFACLPSPQPCALPPITIAWPKWLWSVSVSSPYQQILFTQMNVQYYAPRRLKQREVDILLSSTPIQGNMSYGCSMYEVKCSLVQDQIRQNELLRVPAKGIQMGGIPQVVAKAVTSSPVLSGSDFKYKWLSAEQERRESACFSALAALPRPASRERLSPAGVTLLSSRLKHVLALVSEGRRKRRKQLLIVESEKMMYAIACELRRQGLELVELRGNPTNSNPFSFWESSSVTRFNVSGSACIGLLCLARFACDCSENFKHHYPAPVVESVLICEKVKSPYCRGVYQNVLFMLATKTNAHASVVEVMNDLEARLSFVKSENEKKRENATPEAIRVLFGVNT